MLYGMSTDPEFFDSKLNLFVGMGPSARLTKMNALINFLLDYWNYIEVVMDYLEVKTIGSAESTPIFVVYLEGWFAGVFEFLFHFVTTSNF